MLLDLFTRTEFSHVNTEIFELKYFARCMDCTFCHDSCCQYGADVNLEERDRILAQAESIQQRVTFPVKDWFNSEVFTDPEYPSGQYVRTKVVEGACAFRNRHGRGCLLHMWALDQGSDYHAIKPMVCWLFPVIYDQGVLRASHDVKDDLICRDQGITLYRAARDELKVRFGAPVVEEIDRLEVKYLQQRAEG